MNTNRTSAILFVIVIAALALVTVSFASAPAATSSEDFALRHPEGLPRPVAANPGEDYGPRWAAARQAAYVMGSDFALRHPELMQSSLASIVVNYAGSAYAANDPEFSLRVNSVDTSDYFLRHPELILVAAVDTSDYALRHPELSRK